jgi:CTP:molybdopterin cytidylyltransferase MocA
MNWIRPLRNSTPSKLCAIILASGKGSRFGMPKSEARTEGLLFSELIMRSLKAAGVECIILAQDYHTDSMLETLREAISRQSAEFYLIFPVDHPFVQSETLSLLIAAMAPDTIIKPSYKGRCGHPVIIPATLDLSLDDGGNGLKGIMQNARMPIQYIEVDDFGILRNINRPDDL